MEKKQTELTVQVPRGTRVNVQEVDRLTDADPRIPDDRNVIVSGSEELKIAIKRAAKPGTSVGAAVVLMCG